MTVEPCEKLNNIAFQEACWCYVTLKQGDKLLIGAIYRSPSSTMPNTNRLIELINSTAQENLQYILIVGDFNFPSINWSNYYTLHMVDHPEYRFIEI